MNLFLIIIFFAIGLALIIKGGDVFVDAATWFAEVFKIPKFIIGATVVSIATTLPELFVSILAALDNSVEIAAGNAIGSVTVNMGLIMAISIICLPTVIKRGSFLIKAITMVFSCFLLYMFSLNGELTIMGSIIMLIIFVLSMGHNVFEAKKTMTDDNTQKTEFSKKDLITNIFKFVIGAIAIVVGARLLVDNGQELARAVGISEAVIGVTLIALGTSLPELVTTITAISKKQSSLSIGNIIGANIIDLTLILPMCSVVSRGSLPVMEQTLKLDFPACLTIGILATLPTLITGKFHRLQGIIMLVAYVAYVVILCI